ncbi:hypothetical protein KUCAC02_016523 [Chaenocephalus aceratus]|nr:hypothetical protein KUCAC02_016523 [Chaenocephalus aceratus]
MMHAGPSRRNDPPLDAPDTSHELAFAPETVECFLRDLQHSLSDTSEDVQEASARTAPLKASLDWGTRKSLFSERWKTERPRLVNNTVEQEDVANRICQQCGSKPAAVRCRDCRPSPFFCTECDVGMHTRHVLHNRDAMIAGFFQPLPPSTVVVDKALSLRLVPVEMPAEICSCSPFSLRVNPGKTVAVVTVNGRHDLSMPELSCDACHATWAAGVSGRGVCGGEWSAARETSKRSTSKLDEEGLELAVCRHGVLLSALNMIAVTTKHMSKAGCTDMLTLLAMCWNQQKINNLDTSLSHRYQKATKALQSQMQALETMKAQLAVTESQLEDWVNDVKEWAEAITTKTTADDADALASRIEVLVARIKRRSQRLYKDTDGNKARARIRGKIRKEKEILTSVVESYNRMAPSTETLCLENILSEENAWPWQLPHSDSVDLKTKRRAFDIVNAIRRLQEEEKKIVVIEMDHHWRALQTRGDGLKELSCLLSSETMQNLPWVLSEEGLRGLQSTILRKRQNITERKLQARACYLQVLSGAEHMNFLHRASADEYDSDSDVD